MEAPHQADVGRGERFPIFKGTVAPVFLRLPGMAGKRQPQAAELAEHDRAVRFHGRPRRPRIAVDIENIAGAPVGPSTGVVDQPAGVVSLDPGDDPLRVILAPAFVERDPHDNRGMGAERIDHALQLEFELPGRFLAPLQVGLVSADPAVAVGHILPNQQAQLVAPVIQPVGLHLDMLAQHVAADPLERLQVVAQRLVGRRGVKSVGPPPLVEWSVLEDEPVVEHQPHRARAVLAERDFSHPEVTRDLVDHFVAPLQDHLQIVEERISRRPQLRAADFQAQRGADRTAGLGHRLRALFGPGHNRVAGHGAARLHGQLGNRAVDVRNDVKPADRRIWNRFQPNGLPNAGDGRVPDAAGIEHLLAARLRPLVDRIPDAHHDLLGLSRFEGLGDVEGERVVAAPVRTDLVPVDPDRGIPIDGAEVQQNPLTLPVGRKRELAAVPEPTVGPDRLHHAGERRLDGERHQNLPIEGFDLLFVSRTNRVFPKAVQVMPVLSDHLRAGIFSQRIVGRDVFRPTGHQRTLGRPPRLGREGRAGQRQHKRCQQRKSGFRHQGTPWSSITREGLRLSSLHQTPSLPDWRAAARRRAPTTRQPGQPRRRSLPGAESARRRCRCGSGSAR